MKDNELIPSDFYHIFFQEPLVMKFYFELKITIPISLKNITSIAQFPSKPLLIVFC